MGLSKDDSMFDMGDRGGPVAQLLAVAQAPRCKTSTRDSAHSMQPSDPWTVCGLTYFSGLSGTSLKVTAVLEKRWRLTQVFTALGSPASDLRSLRSPGALHLIITLEHLRLFSYSTQPAPASIERASAPRANRMIAMRNVGTRSTAPVSWDKWNPFL